MIKEGDRVAVGVSGGKDSLALLVALTQLSRFYPEKFEVVAITLEMGYDEMDFSPVQALCDRLGVEYIRVPTQIGPIIFDIRHEENPCALCAKMRRGALHDAARDLPRPRRHHAHPSAALCAGVFRPLVCKAP